MRPSSNRVETEVDPQTRHPALGVHFVSRMAFLCGTSSCLDATSARLAITNGVMFLLVAFCFGAVYGLRVVSLADFVGGGSGQVELRTRLPVNPLLLLLCCGLSVVRKLELALDSLESHGSLFPLSFSNSYLASGVLSMHDEGSFRREPLLWIYSGQAASTGCMPFGSILVLPTFDFP